MIKVRPTRPDEWEQMRLLRHAALADSPTAFAETLTESNALAEAVWRHRATPTDRQVTLVATDGDSRVGMCAVIRYDATDRARLVAVWVDPGQRGKGVATSLLDAAIAWCARQQIGHLTTAVNETNLPAASAYRKAGFVETGDRKPMPNHPEHFEIDLALPIGSDR